MRLRTIALALALGCGLTATGEAKKNTPKVAAKAGKVKRASKRKVRKPAHAKRRKPAKVRHA